MRARFRNSITIKMILLVLGGTSIVFSLVFGYSYTSSKQAILESSEQYAHTLALSVSRRVDQDFRAVAKVTESLALFLEETRCDKPPLLRVIKRTVEGNKELYGSTVAFEPYAFDATEKEFAPYYYKDRDGLKYEDLGAGSYNYAERDWYYIPRELKAPVWAEPYFDDGGGRILMTTYSVPLFEKIGDSERKLKAIVTGDVSLEWLAKMLNSIKIGERGYCFIVSDTGVFVAAS